MDKRQELIAQTATRLAEVKTIGELKTSVEEVYTLMETLFQSSIDVFRKFVENMDGIPDEELQKKAMMFQDESFLLPPEIMEEMERMDNMQGDPEFIDAFSVEMEKRIDPYIDQFGPLAEKLMDKLMSGSMGDLMNEMKEGMDDLVGGMADAMGDAMGGMGEEEREPEFVFDYDNVATPRMMYELYSSRTWEDLDTELLIDEMEEQLQNDVWELEGLTDEHFGGPKDAALESIAEIRTRIEVYDSELDKELTRLGGKSDKADEAAALKKEIMSKVSLKVKEIRHYLSKV